MRLPFVALTLVLALAPAHPQSLNSPRLSAAEQHLLQEAREAQMRGDETRAFEAYKSLLQSGRDAVDVALNVAAIARARLGASGARALFHDMDRQNPAVSLAGATLSELSERRKALETFVAAHPDYGPAYALLAAEHRQDRIDEQPLRDRLREHELLTRFLGFDVQGKLAQSFVDASVLAAWIDRAERRVASLEVSLAGAAAVPTAQFTRSNSDWMVHLNMPEEPSEVRYRVGLIGPFVPTDPTGSVDQRTGRKYVSTDFTLPLDTPTTTLFILYRDVLGHEAGPFPIPFDPHAIILSQARETLDAPNSGWAIFTTGTTKDWVYFNTPLYTRCAIAKLEYGFNGPPDTHFPLPPCDFRDPSSSPADAQSAVKMEPEVRMVSVRITFIDGKVETRNFRRPPPR
jgi:hypothetical protein